MKKNAGAFHRKSYYSLLGVGPTSPIRDVKKAYRTLASEYHPDHAGENGLDSFLRIKDAFETLTDKQKKAEYDRGLYRASSIAPNTKSARPVKHNLRFVKSFMFREKHGLNMSWTSKAKVITERDKCVLCGGYGTKRDKFNRIALCKSCGGTGRLDRDI